jgi:hypothetical protein
MMADHNQELSTPLTKWTVSRFYPVDRMEMLRNLANKTSSPDFIIITDDDVIISGGSIRTCIADFNQQEVVLGQPAHHSRSYCNYPSLFQTGTDTSFISSPEIGPLVIVKGEYFSHFFPSWIENQGYGLEFFWNHLRLSHSLRFGLHNKTSIMHLQETNTFVNESDLNQLQIMKSLFDSKQEIVQRI